MLGAGLPEGSGTGSGWKRRPHGDGGPREAKRRLPGDAGMHRAEQKLASYKWGSRRRIVTP